MKRMFGTAAIVILIGVSTFGQPIPPGALSPSKPVFMGGQQVATTGASGDLLLALDSTKNFVVLHQECSRYEIVEATSQQARDCERENERNPNGCRRCEIAGWITGGAWKRAATASSSMAPSSMPSFGASRGTFNWYVGGGASMGTASDLPDGVTNIQNALVDLRYNTTTGESDNKSTGFFVTGGVSLGTTPVRPVIGVSYQTSGDLTNNASGTRINVAGSLSNLNFTSDTTTTVSIFGVNPGVVIPLGDRVFVVPMVNLDWGRFESVNSQRLLAGPVGPTPATFEINRDSQSSEVTKFGVGFGVEGGVRLNPWLNVIGRYGWHNFTDVFEQPQVARLPADQSVQSLYVGLSFGKP